MGIKVESENFFSELLTMKGLNGDSYSSSCVFYPEDKMTTHGHYYYDITTKHRDRYPNSEMEMLKETMIKQEDIFQKQVYELHRLYKIQKDLMDALKRKELHYSSSAEMTHSSIKTPQNLWKIPNAPLRNFNMVPVTSGTDARYFPNFTSENHIPFNLTSYQTENGRGGDVLSSKIKQFHKKTFDLHLSADEYVDSDNEECIRKDKYLSQRFDLLDSNIYITHESMNGIHFCKGHGSTLDSHSESSPQTHIHSNRVHGFTDLNEPVREFFGEKATASTSVNFLGSTIGFQELPNKQTPSLTTHNTTKNFLEETLKDGNQREVSKFSIVDNRREISEWPCGIEHGRRRGDMNPSLPGVGDKKFPCLEPTVKIIKSNDLPKIFSSVPLKTESWLKEKVTQSISIRNSEIGVKVHSNYNFLSHQNDKPTISSHLLKQNSGLEAVSGVSCPYLSSSNSNVNNEHYDEGSRKQFKTQHSTDVKSTKTMNLNVMPFDGFWLEEAHNDKEIDAMSNEDAKRIDSLTNIPWLKKCGKHSIDINCSIDTSNFAQYSNGEFLSHQHNPDLDQDASNSSRMDIRSSNSKDWQFCYDFSVDFNNPKGRAKLSVEDTVRSSKLEKVHSDVRNFIDLNHSLEGYNEESVGIEFLSKNSVDVSISSLKIQSSIDLEMPVTSFAAKGINSGTKDEIKTPSLLQQCDVEIPEKQLILLAAESIIALSSDFCTPGDINASFTLSSLPEDSLHWFAKVVTSSALNYEEESDYFEAMTLNLTEIKADEYLFEPLDPEIKKDDIDMGLLLTRPRRGQARKRRQRRDFQRDILPSLATLSRHEVAEDLQTINGLLKDSGQSWQTRKKTNKTGPRSKKNGEKIPTVVSIPLKPINYKLNLKDGSLKGWGKTRRCRRQRFPVGNVSIPLT